MLPEDVVTIPRLIIIDDDEIDQFLNKRIVERSGLVEQLILFRSAEEALEYLRDQPSPVDVIFLDINMPRMNGFEFLDQAVDELGQDFAKIIVVMLTTSLDPADSERASTYDVVKKFENKPLSLNTIEEVRLMLSGRGSDDV